ncbi:Fibrinogen-like protein 1,Fibrinogen-like protein A,Tenascin,Ryncolin-2,Ryncolin-4,Techylectin-5A,Tenascin-N, Angiopoietin-related protein 7,Ficolin-2,Ryncolin-1,Tenascin-R,Ryncolin-3,Ficolin-1 [Mytilus coruscus]|uniref:Fibrinogen-like protein 1,Fibrinogen-like protein A,Tenascin,Ryncolin-2,Ryncolin-4,Techylectin-5A,Tenascin-N, Angiopoietin-related protein 7,Ficolin-2,Ryncolin-1,Tenascin-R,Ryncolin-3,Ficolin-1 n=1 Tax=Mytilus coruscus TaxID=42192 RepID=A0A6J8ERE4_MYTCO|nr:Fibrinogen-like protein 1,Fibrinogen-like protein A,Tenascin,Ryncolin-2,Ryncolin-4,Techylectin-5A,Tenascin-N, Angiopoietin-related protein 7,Ficolin-2,Ryncolin-1,Tenascin-R,Ryncolin-3,Ficolin-1 [Mytilus coruscus]
MVTLSTANQFQFHLDDLQKESLQYIEENTETCLLSSYAIEINNDCVQMILMSEYLSCSETEVCTFFLKWIETQCTMQREIRQYRKSSEEDGRVDTIWNELQGICLHGNPRGTVQELKKDTQVLLKNMAIYKDFVKMNKQLKKDIIWILEETRGEKEISRIVNLLKNDFKGTCEKPVKDCTELKKYNKQSGVYKISHGNSKDLKVYCDMTTDGGGWSIIQRHQDSTVDFQRTWAEYENGFGNVESDYWLGNKHIHHMTSSGKYELRIDLTNNKNEKRYAAYKQFSIGDAASKYKLSVGSYSGNAGDSMKFHNGMLFSSTDQDNDQAGGDCVKRYGPWWHKHCCTSALNNKLSSNLYWDTFPNDAAKSSVMMIRRI